MADNPILVFRLDVLYKQEGRSIPGADPIVTVIVLMLWFAMGTAVLGSATGELSWVDRLW